MVKVNAGPEQGRIVRASPVAMHWSKGRRVDHHIGPAAQRLHQLALGGDAGGGGHVAMGWRRRVSL
jgi:hypothetical protein